MAEWQPPAELRLAAAWAGLEWARASLTRSIEHLRRSGRPGLEPLIQELAEFDDRLIGLQLLTGAVWMEQKE